MIFGFLFLLQTVSIGAYAYTPPAQFIIGKIRENQARFRTWELVSNITDLRNGIVFKETLRVDFASGKMSAEYSSFSGENQGSVARRLGEVQALGIAFLKLDYSLQKLGVEPPTSVAPEASEIGKTGEGEKKGDGEKNSVAEKESVKIGRIQSRPVWYWGEENKIFIEKDQFSLAGYQSPSVGFYVTRFTEGAPKLPRVVIFKKGNQDCFQYELKGAKFNQPSSVALNAKQSQNQGLSQELNQAGVDPAKASSKEAIKEAIKEWVELVR